MKQEREDAGPLSELDFWTGRAADLGSLAAQLAGERVQSIAHALQLAGSTYAPALQRCGCSFSSA